MAAKERPQAREQFIKRKRLDQVVVRTRIQSGHAVRDGIACGQHEDRHVGNLAQPLADLQAIDAGKHQVQDHCVWQVRAGMTQRAFAVFGRDHVIALKDQASTQQVTNSAVVFDNKYGFSHERCVFANELADR